MARKPVDKRPVFTVLYKTTVDKEALIHADSLKEAYEFASGLTADALDDLPGYVQDTELEITGIFS